MPTTHHTSAAARKVLSQLGGDLRDARRRRRLPMSVVADRAFTSRSTLQRVEAGDPAVSMGVGAPAKEIHRMASAFEHDALRQALALP